MPGDPKQAAEFADSYIRGKNKARPRRLTAAGQPKVRKARKATVPKGPPTSADDPRLDQYLADPALRSKLDERLLSPEQRRQRTQNADPYHRPVSDMVRARFAEPEALLREQIGKQQTHQGNVNSWFDQYRQALQQSAEQQKQAEAGAVQNVQGMAAGLAQLASQQTAGRQQGMEADAANRGAVVDGSVQRTATDANLLRNALGNTSAATIQAQGLNNQGALRGVIDAALGQKALALQGEQQRGSSLEADLKRLAEEKGLYRNQARQELQEADWKRALEEQAFGLDKAKLEASVRDQSQRRVISRANSRTQAKNAATARINATKPAAKKKPTSGPGSLTDGKQGGYVKDIESAADAIRGGAKRTDILNAPGGRTPQERRVIANAANDMARLGFLSPVNVRALQALGVSVKGFPRSRKQAREQGTLPKQKVGSKVGEVLKGIGNTVNVKPSTGATLGGDE